MVAALVIFGVIIVALIFACLKVSGDCSRQEEQEEMERRKNG